MGGIIRGNDARVGEGLFLAGGDCRMGGVIDLSSVYLSRGVTILAEDGLVYQGERLLLSLSCAKRDSVL